MDAAEHDLDAKLYKASDSLIDEIQHKLPCLIYKPNSVPRQYRLRVLDAKCDEVRVLLDRFQEWPQILDPHLAKFIQILADAFVDYLTRSSHHYESTRQHEALGISPLPRSICRLLYAFCKVRGHKVVVRLLDNQPKYLAPMLHCFSAWSNPSFGMTWEERYVMMQWLSHLILAPFELTDISAGTSQDHDVPDLLNALGNVAGFAQDLAALAFRHLGSAGQEREAASVLLVRLCQRADMQAHGMPLKLLKYTNDRLLHDSQLLAQSPYSALGYLSLVYGILASSTDREIAGYLETQFRDVLELATAQTSHCAAIRDLAPARKWMLKILRSVVTHAIPLASSAASTVQEDLFNKMLEESVQHFLDALGDKDTPVRMAAAKGLSVITRNLPSAMSIEVIEAVLACLQENVLREDRHSRALRAMTDVSSETAAGMQRNLAAVDPLRWHGLMLTLGHLLFRRSPPPEILPAVAETLILGLEFEQRSAVGTSIGVGVRDAACFGLWALARKYRTAEISRIAVSAVPGVARDEVSSALEVIASKLIVSSCFDPSGNIRRGSSAALQELIGRHPDTIPSGISVVQIVDYHAVARLSRAMTEISPQAAALDRLYHRSLLQAATEWRGSRAVDASQRRWSASTIQSLSDSLPSDERLSLCREVIRRTLDLKSQNVGSTAGARHGLMLASKSAIDSFLAHDRLTCSRWLGELENPVWSLARLTGQLDGRVNSDLELVMESTCSLIGTLSQCLLNCQIDREDFTSRWLPDALAVVEHCTVSSTRDMTLQAATAAMVHVLRLLQEPVLTSTVASWVEVEQTSALTNISRGRILVLGRAFVYLAQERPHDVLQNRLVAGLMDIVDGGYKIETRVDAMESLGEILGYGDCFPNPLIPRLCDILRIGLNDYTIDQRGDIGSKIRLQTLAAIDLLRNNHRAPPPLLQAAEVVMPLVAKLAAERLNKVRFHAWKCLERHWQLNLQTPQLQRTFDHPADVSSVHYYGQLMTLLTVVSVREQLFLGVVSSATSSSDDICRAACDAFVQFMHQLDVGDRETLIRKTSACLIQQLDGTSASDDRQLLSLLDFLCFLLDQDLYAPDGLESAVSARGDIWQIVQKFHGSSASLPKLEALLNVYSRLAVLDEFRDRAMDKLTRHLLHRWPKIRNHAANLIYFDTPNSTLALCNWGRPVAELKPYVLAIRKQLGVAATKAVNKPSR